MNSPERLGPEDVAILRLESPRIAGHTCKVITVAAPSSGSPIALDDLRDHVASRLERVPRMTQRLAEGGGYPSWRPDERFDVRHHVLPWSTRRPASRSELLDITGRLMATRLDRTRPLWSIHLVDLESDRRALVLLIHHCMADGMTAVRMCAQTLWDPLVAADAPESRDVRTPHSASATTFDLRGLLRRELMPSADDTPLDRHPSAQRSVAATKASLSRLKQIGHGVSPAATVNDVVLCLVAGGLRRWLQRRNAPLHHVRVKVPVSLHHHDEASNELGNHDSFLVLDVGVDEPDPAARLRRIAAETRERKARHDAQSLGVLLEELRHVSNLAAHALSSWSASPRVFTVNVSNVPGPSMPIAVMGAPVRDLFTLAEIADRHALRVAVISVSDEISFGLCADRAAVQDPETIAAGIEADLSALT